MLKNENEESQKYENPDVVFTYSSGGRCHISVKPGNGRTYTMSEIAALGGHADKNSGVYAEYLRVMKEFAVTTSPLPVMAAAELAQATLSMQPKKKPVIERAPGYQLYGFLSTICSKKFVERELSGLLAEGNFQYQELLAEGNIAGAKRWKWSMRLDMIRTVFGGAINPLLGMVGIIRKLSE